MKSSTVAHRRRDRRLGVSRAYAAYVEFDHPQPNGYSWRLTLLDISVAGVSFALAEDLDGIEVGSAIADACVRLEEHEFRGDLVVMRVTPVPELPTVCGALVYPADEDELEKLKNAIAWIEAAQTN